MDTSRMLKWLISFALAFSLISPLPLRAEDASSKYVADGKGIYRVDARGHRQPILNAKNGELFIDSSLDISPDKNWALIDYVPSNPGKGRVEEVRILVSLKTGLRVDPEPFKAKHGVWLSALSEWERNSPATIVMEDGKHVPIQ